MKWYLASDKRSLNEIANDSTIGVGKRIHEMRYVNGVSFDKALDAVGQVAGYMSRDKIIDAYHKHLNKSLENGVTNPYEEAFMKSELPNNTERKASLKQYYVNSNKSPCPMHDDSYVKNELGHYVDKNSVCMSCNHDAYHAYHMARCYTEKDAERIMKIDDLQYPNDGKDAYHFLYHFANNLTKASIDHQLNSEKDASRIHIETKKQLKNSPCDPEYNPWENVNWGN